MRLFSTPKEDSGSNKDGERESSFLPIAVMVGRVAMESSTVVAPLYHQLKKEGFDARFAGYLCIRSRFTINIKTVSSCRAVP